jgi:uncharacterized protein
MYMTSSQAIRQPFGVTTFGSTVIRVDPDIASIQFAISRTEIHPKESFRVVREASKKVADYLQHADFKKETSSSRISLSQAWDFVGGTRKFVGYTAKATFYTLLYDLDQLENLLVGIVDAGANEISDVDFQTSRLKELRSEARRKAVEAATEKAKNYCLAAQIKLGGVIHIEDINPDMLGRRYEGHMISQNEIIRLEPAETEDLQAFNPGGITVSAAVLMSFNIANE